MRRGNNERGFLMAEVLMAILILAVAFTAFMGAMAQAVRVSSKAGDMTDAISVFEPFLFEVENGLRPDLAGYGGRGALKDKYLYQFEAQTHDDTSSCLKGNFKWKEGKESLDIEVLVSPAAVYA